MQLTPRHSLIQFKIALTAALAPRRLLTKLWYRLYRKHSVQQEPPRAAVIEMAPIHADVSFRELSFTFALIALSARVACAGAPLSREKYAAFRGAFPLSGGMCGKLRALFTLACETQAPIDYYVGQIRHVYPRKLSLFTALIDRLFTIATADENLTPQAERLLAKISHMLDLSPAQFTELRARHLEPRKPHEVLGVAKRSPYGMVRKHYHELMRRYHPDRFADSDVSPEVELLLQLKVSEINAAYRQMTRKKAA